MILSKAVSFTCCGRQCFYSFLISFWKAASSLLKKNDHGITKNYRGITLISIAVKAYNVLLLNPVKPDIKKILRIRFWKNGSMTSHFLTIHWIIEGVHTKNLKATLLFIDFSKAFDSIHRGKMEQILLAYDLLKETFNAVMTLYKNMNAVVHSSDDNTNFFDIVVGVF